MEAAAIVRTRFHDEIKVFHIFYLISKRFAYIGVSVCHCYCFFLRFHSSFSSLLFCSPFRYNKISVVNMKRAHAIHLCFCVYFILCTLPLLICAIERENESHYCAYISKICLSMAVCHVLNERI